MLLPHSQGLQAAGRGNAGVGGCKDTDFGWGKESRTLEQPSHWTSEASEPLGQQQEMTDFDLGLSQAGYLQNRA